MQIKVTDNAIKKISIISHNRDKCLLLEISPGGCSGLSYQFSLFDFHQLNDDYFIVYDKDRPVFAIEKKFLPYFQDAIINYQSSLLESKFVIEKNEMAANNCGCGSSFKPKGFI